MKMPTILLLLFVSTVLEYDCNAFRPSLSKQFTGNCVMSVDSNQKEDVSSLSRALYVVKTSVSAVLSVAAFSFSVPSMAHARLQTQLQASQISSVKSRNSIVKESKNKQAANTKKSKVQSGPPTQIKKSNALNGNRKLKPSTTAKPFNEVVESDSAANQKKLTYIGLGLAAASIMASLLADNTPSSKHPAVGIRSYSPDDEVNPFDIPRQTKPLDPVKTFVEGRPRRLTPPPPLARRSETGASHPFYEPTNFTVEEDNLPNLTSDSASYSSTNLSKDESASEELRESKEALLKPNPSRPSETLMPPAAIPKKQGGILNRLFQKPGGNREPDLAKVLEKLDTAASLRSVVATILAKILPQQFPEFSEEGVMYDESVRGLNPESELDLLRRLAIQGGLSAEQSAEVFAEITSAMLVTVVDAAVEVVERSQQYKTGADAEESQKAVLQAIDSVTAFLASAGALFIQLHEGVQIEPVQYNGRAKKSSLESMYSAYFKATAEQEMKRSLEMLTAPSIAVDGEIAGGVNADSVVKEDLSAESAIAEADGDAKMADRAQLTGLLQRALAIKEGKRNSLEQKVTKELMMSLGGGGGGLDDIMSALSGKGGMPDMKALEQMMAGSGMSGKGGEGNPLDNMSQEEMLQATKESMQELKQQIKEGVVTKEMVIEMEKGMGLDFRDFLKMLDNPGVRDSIKTADPALTDAIEVFKQLVKIKNGS